MELSLSGNALKTFTPFITSLARVGTDLVFQASLSPSLSLSLSLTLQFVFHTLNSSRSAYQSITFKSDFFDAFNLQQSNNLNSSDQIQCSVLLKSVRLILRTPISSVDRLSAVLPSADAVKLQWTLQCHNGVKKTYWISCNVEPDIQHLSLNRRRFPSSFVVRPRDLTRWLSNFQTSLQEITIIATEPSALPSDAAGEIGGKAVELRSYIDPTKDGAGINCNPFSQHHPSNWVGAGDDEDDDEGESYVQPMPQYYD